MEDNPNNPLPENDDNDAGSSGDAGAENSLDDSLETSLDNSDEVNDTPAGVSSSSINGMVYIRVQDIGAWYDSLVEAGVAIHPNGALATKPWGQREFSLLDPDHNLLTFGQGL